MVIYAAFLGGAGLFVGSFLGLVSWRLPRGEGVVLGRSRCGGCGRPIPPWRMVPVISWIMSRGRCADCRATIPLRYPLMEAGAGLIGVWAGLHHAAFVPALLTTVLGWQLLLLAVVDGERGDPEVDLAERVVSAGCAVQNMLLMATAQGYGSALTSGKALKATGLRTLFQLAASEQALCFISMGTVVSRKAARVRPAASTYVSTLDADRGVAPGF